MHKFSTKAPAWSQAGCKWHPVRGTVAVLDIEELGLSIVGEIPMIALRFPGIQPSKSDLSCSMFSKAMVFYFIGKWELCVLMSTFGGRGECFDRTTSRTLHAMCTSLSTCKGTVGFGSVGVTAGFACVEAALITSALV